jgi:hypothetical protein
VKRSTTFGTTLLAQTVCGGLIDFEQQSKEVRIFDGIGRHFCPSGGCLTFLDCQHGAIFLVCQRKLLITIFDGKL